MGDKVSSKSWLTGISSKSVEIIDSALIMDGLSGTFSIYAIHSTTTVSGASHVLLRKIEATDNTYAYGLTTGSAGYELTATQDYYCRTDSVTDFALNANVEESGIAYFELYTAVHQGYHSNGDGTHYYGCPATCLAAIKGENEDCDGTATCTAPAHCDVCGESYGEPLGHTPVADRCTDLGNGTHSYACDVCGEIITEEHNYVDCKCIACGKVQRFTITFVDTGDNTYAPITKEYGADVDALADPTKTGYIFTGWYDEEGNKTELPTVMPAHDITVKAGWIECNHNGGTPTCTASAVCTTCGADYFNPNNHEYDKNNGICCETYQPATQNADGYYEIGNAGQLYWFAEQVNVGNTGYNAKLLNDIIVNENVLVNGELNTDDDAVASFRQWIAIGSDSNKYIGTFDGQGYEIKGLYMNTAEKQSLGLFGYLGEGAVVKNLGVVDGYLVDTSINSSYPGGDSCDGGGIARYANKATISKCYNTCTIKAGGDVGGIVGSNFSSRIEYCYNAGNVICTAASNAPWYPAAGGIAGGNYSTATSHEIIYSCYNIGTISSGFYYIGSINGSLTGCPSQNCYYLSATDNGKGGKTAEQFASGEVAYLLQQGNTEQVWGQDSNQAGAMPVFDSTGLYKVVTVGETGNYSVANVGDTNGDGTVDVVDYQVLVNKALADDHEQIETASYDDIVKYDLDGDGYLDVIDASLMERMINGHKTVDVYAVGDYNKNGVEFEEADILAIAEALKNPETPATYKKYACDINADGKASYEDLNTLTSMFPLYFVGEE